MGTVNLILALFSLPYASDAINCLVMRPGYGLVTESCPSSTVGCRIKARSNNVEWYEWSKLYDRNQLVCIYPGEYEGTAGCVRKPSGNIRCWCGGIDDCNDPETSRQLLEAFQKSDREKIDYIAQKLEAGEKLSPATTSTTTTVQTRSTRPPAVRKIVPHKKPTVFKMLKTTRRTTTTTTTTTPIVTIPSTTITTDQPIENVIEQEYPLPTEGETQFGMTFDETRKKLNEEMREEDERLQQLLADEEAEMSRDEEDDALEEQMQKERERNRMERRERARADERRRQTEEETLRNKERSQKHRETLDSDEDDYGSFAETRSKSTTTSLSLFSSTCSLLLLLLRLIY